MDKDIKLEINCRITDSILIQDDKFPYSKYITYVIKIFTKFNDWEIRRRFKNFEELNSKLIKLKHSSSKLPSKKLFNLSPEVIAERKDCLEVYLNQIVNNNNLGNCKEILEFIELDQDTYNLFIGKNHTFEKSSLVRKSQINNSIDSITKSRSTENLMVVSKNINDLNPKMGKNEINDFLNNLEFDPMNKSSYIKEKEGTLKKSRFWQHLKRFEIAKLFFGDFIIKGLLYQSGLIEQNIYGAQACLEFISKLIDYDYNIECENYISVLKAGDLEKYNKMNLIKHLQSDNTNIAITCFKIIRVILNEEKKITIDKLIEDKVIAKKFEDWNENK